MDALRPPTTLDPSAGAYKDWLHLNVFDPLSGSVGLINASLHGAPERASSLAVGAALFSGPSGSFYGNVEVMALSEAKLGAASILLERTAVAADHRARHVYASARFDEDGARANLIARYDKGARPIRLERRLPFGSGWISWLVVPRLQLEGTLELGGKPLALDAAVAYHDHNWGRFHWGDDIGWEWGVFPSSASGPCVVFSRASDRNHQRLGEPILVLDHCGRRRSFQGEAVELEFGGRFAGRLRRLPGALAALRQDRMAPDLPGRLRVRASDGVDFVEVRFWTRAAAQLIAADPERSGCSFVHELTGRALTRGQLGGTAFEEQGAGVFEYVD